MSQKSNRLAANHRPPAVSTTHKSRSVKAPTNGFTPIRETILASLALTRSDQQIALRLPRDINPPRIDSGEKEIYFEQGAMEFWVSDSFGNISFLVKEGKIEHSKIAKIFPLSNYK